MNYRYSQRTYVLDVNIISIVLGVPFATVITLHCALQLINVLSAPEVPITHATAFIAIPPIQNCATGTHHFLVADSIY